MDFYGGYLEVMLITGVLVFLYCGVLALIYGRSNRKARRRAQRPRTPGDDAIVVWAVVFPMVVAVAFPYLWMNETPTGVLWVVLGSALLTAFYQYRAWGTWNGAAVLAIGSVVIAGASAGALFYGASQGGLVEPALDLLLIVLAPLLWFGVLGSALERDVRAYLALHGPDSAPPTHGQDGA